VTFYHLARTVVLGACRVLFRVRVVGREHVPARGAYIVAPTHRSILDIPFAAFVTGRRIRFLAKEELFSTGVGRRLFGALGAIRVDRGTTDRGALRSSLAALAAGEPLAVFPEGTRQRGPELATLFDGAAFLAVTLGLPIVPVGIGGSEKIMPSGRILPRLHRVVVVVGSPITPAELDGRSRRAEAGRVTTRLREELQGCFDDARGRAGE
jgi:1-acyl-sn-glycerol-3-phosphate acyltransferase